MARSIRITSRIFFARSFMFRSVLVRISAPSSTTSMICGIFALMGS
ncbi:hypothetical protein SMICM304S_05077 [Streptomyces microflavus]